MPNKSPEIDPCGTPFQQISYYKDFCLIERAEIDQLDRNEEEIKILLLLLMNGVFLAA